MNSKNPSTGSGGIHKEASSIPVDVSVDIPVVICPVGQDSTADCSPYDNSISSGIPSNL